MIELLLQVTPVTGGGVSFLGEVPVNALITGNALATAIGLTAGTAQFSNEPWLKFNLDGKTLFVAKKPYRSHISWDHINVRGAVFGTRTVVINGETYRVRLLKGSATDPYVGGTTAYDPVGAYGSEWNRLFYPLVPNPTSAPSKPSGEGLVYGALADYTETDLVMVSTAGNGSHSWCQEIQGTNRIRRGYYSVSYLSQRVVSSAVASHGWRPVLELIP